MISPAAVITAALDAGISREHIERLARAIISAPTLYDPDRREIIGARRVRVTSQQARVFAALVNAPGRLVPVAALIDALVNDDADGGAMAAVAHLRVVVCALRRALREAGAAASIATVRGDGYRLDREGVR